MGREGDRERWALLSDEEMSRTCSLMIALGGAQLRHTPCGHGWCPLLHSFFPRNDGKVGGTHMAHDTLGPCLNLHMALFSSK